MKRLQKLILPALIVIEAVLVGTRLIDLSDAIIVVVLIELALFVAGAWRLALSWRKYRGRRSEGLDVWESLEGGLEPLMPRVAARAISLEVKLWYCLGRWVLRKTAPAANEFQYHRRSIMPLLLFAAGFEIPVEVFLLELFVPWLWLKWLVLILSIYTVLWLFGYYASMVVMTHRLEPDGLRILSGLFVEGFVPYSDIESVDLDSAKVPDTREGFQVNDERQMAIQAFGGRTDLIIRLESPHSFQGFLRESPPVKIVRLSANKPDLFVRAIQERVRDASTPTQDTVAGLGGTTSQEKAG